MAGGLKHRGSTEVQLASPTTLNSGTVSEREVKAETVGSTESK